MAVLEKQDVPDRMVDNIDESKKALIEEKYACY